MPAGGNETGRKSICILICFTLSWVDLKHVSQHLGCSECEKPVYKYGMHSRLHGFPYMGRPHPYPRVNRQEASRGKFRTKHSFGSLFRKDVSRGQNELLFTRVNGTL